MVIKLKTPENQGLVPGTGFEPAQPFGCCHLKTVRLPISPPGRAANIINQKLVYVQFGSESIRFFFVLFRLRFPFILIPINSDIDPKIKTKNGNE